MSEFIKRTMNARKWKPLLVAIAAEQTQRLAAAH